MEFESVKAVRDAAASFQRHDYLLAARSCMTALEKDVRDPAALRVSKVCCTSSNDRDSSSP